MQLQQLRFRLCNYKQCSVSSVKVGYVLVVCACVCVILPVNTIAWKF